MNYSISTETLINAASRLKDVLPEGTPVQEVMAHWMKSAKADDAGRGMLRHYLEYTWMTGERWLQFGGG